MARLSDLIEPNAAQKADKARTKRAERETEKALQESVAEMKAKALGDPDRLSADMTTPDPAAIEDLPEEAKEDAKTFALAMESALDLYPEWGPDNLRNHMQDAFKMFVSCFITKTSPATGKTAKQMMEEYRAKHPETEEEES